MKKVVRDKKGHFRKHLAGVDEELKTLKKIVMLFKRLEFKDSHRWIIWWLCKKYL